MATIKRFEDLECWQEARKLVRLVYELTKRELFRKDFELVCQVRKSAVSTMANSAEGFHRASDKDFMRFLDYARSSVAETVSHCYVALDQAYLSEGDIDSVKDQAEVVWKKINRFVTYLSRSGRKTNQTNQTS
jgi:four helix bundle protein